MWYGVYATRQTMQQAEAEPHTKFFFSCFLSQYQRIRSIWFIAVERSGYYTSYADIHATFLVCSFFILFTTPPLAIVSLQHAFFSAWHQNSLHPPHKFAHLDYTALENMSPQVRENRKMWGCHFTVLNRTDGVSSRIHDYLSLNATASPSILLTLSPFWYVKYSIPSRRYWSGNHMTLGGLGVVIQ